MACMTPVADSCPLQDGDKGHDPRMFSVVNGLHRETVSCADVGRMRSVQLFESCRCEADPFSIELSIAQLQWSSGRYKRLLPPPPPPRALFNYHSVKSFCTRVSVDSDNERQQPSWRIPELLPEQFVHGSSDTTENIRAAQRLLFNRANSMGIRGLSITPASS